MKDETQINDAKGGINNKLSHMDAITSRRISLNDLDAIKRFLSEDSREPQFVQIEMLEDSRRGNDLRPEVSVFVTTVGAPDFLDCFVCLCNQDCLFNLYIIKNVAPMSRAFQMMIDECKTGFYIQVDEDMLLHPHAVRTLYQGITARDNNVAIFLMALFDVFTRYNLSGVKIYRHQILSRFPYMHQDFSCEVDQVSRMIAAGYSVVGDCPELTGDSSKCVGDLNAYWTPWRVFEKYSRDLQKYRLYPVQQDWMRLLTPLFMQRLQENPNNIVALFALAGALAGLTCPLTANGEKDFRDTKFRDIVDQLAGNLGIDPDQVIDVRRY